MATLTPIQARYQEIMADSTYLTKILQHGQEKAATVANQTLNHVRDAMGFCRQF